MRKMLIGICVIAIGVMIIYFNGGFKTKDMVIKNEAVSSINNILVEDFVGTIEIKKSNNLLLFRLLPLLPRNPIEVPNLDGDLKIKSKSKKWFNFGQFHSKVVIEYSKDMINIDVNDVVGDVSIEMPQISNLDITDVVGDINIKSNGTVNILKNEDILVKVSFENITQSSNSSQKIKFSDVVGVINIF